MLDFCIHSGCISPDKSLLSLRAAESMAVSLHKSGKNVVISGSDELRWCHRWSGAQSPQDGTHSTAQKGPTTSIPSTVSLQGHSMVLSCKIKACCCVAQHSLCLPKKHSQAPKLGFLLKIRNIPAASWEKPCKKTHFYMDTNTFIEGSISC